MLKYSNLCSMVASCTIILSLLDLSIAQSLLDDILFESMIPTSSKRCISNAENARKQTTSFTFTHEPSPSTWATTAAKFEPELFVAEMKNENQLDQNKSWTIRVGQGGNIYSFRGAYGEAIPPQKHGGGEYVDEVTQTVSVDMALNQQSGGLYYIHQGGVYRNDGNYTKNPFFSPNLATHCKDKLCRFASWGQQAQLKTKFKSDLLYFNSYRDCGDGIIEFTSVLHNAADIKNGDTLTYLNVPWGGVRQSTLRDVFFSDKKGKLEMDYPPKYFGPSDAMKYQKNTGGYTVFTEKVIVPDDVYEQHPFDLPTNVTLVIADDPASKFSSAHSNQFKRYCMYATLVPTATDEKGCKDCDLWLTNKRSGDKVHAKMVLYWAYKGKYLYFCPEDDIKEDDFNSMFKKGDEIIVSRTNIGKPMDDNLALAFVYGNGSTSIEERYAPSRIRWGKCGNLDRDFTVYTSNSFVTLDPGDTYIYQQFIVTGRLSDMQTQASPWVGEVHEELVRLGEMSGTNITLYSKHHKAFGVHLENELPCSKGVRRCVGKSAPGVGLRALFAIKCGRKTYVGSDKYHFSHKDSKNGYVRSYTCKGESKDMRPEWKLLGFFEEGACSYLKSAAYESDFCEIEENQNLASILFILFNISATLSIAVFIVKSVRVGMEYDHYTRLS